MIDFANPSLAVGSLCWFDGDQPIRVARHIGLDHRMKDLGVVNAVLAVQSCVELFLGSDLVLVKKHGGTFLSGLNVTKMFDDDHDRRFIIQFSVCHQLLRL